MDGEIMDVDTDESFANTEDYEIVVVYPDQMQENIENTTVTSSLVPNKRGRKPQKNTSEKINKKDKLEKNRRMAKECRMRKTLRYQYLEDMVDERERAVLALRAELDKYVTCCKEISEGKMPHDLLEELGISAVEK